MSDNIAKMTDKQLRNEVQLLRDELAKMKRQYEDIIYNLDTENFSSRFTREQKNMKSAIEFTAEGIKTKVSKEDLDKSLSEYSTIVQTASMINTTVTKEYVIDKLGDDYVTNAVLSSEIKQTADEIYLSVSGNYETKADANVNYNALHSSISSVSIEADNISTRVGSLENGEYKEFTLFEQKTDGFYLTGDVHLSGDLISGGTISGATLANSSNTHRIEMSESSGTDYGTFRLYNNHYGSVPYFSIYDDTYGTVGFRGAGDVFLGVKNSGGITVKPYGAWDFSNCTSIDWGDFGTGGGTAVAVFG